MSETGKPMPKPTAQVAAHVEVMGAETAVLFLLTYGGAELYISGDPKGRSGHEGLMGYDKANPPP